MTNKDSQSNKEPEKELDAKEERFTLDKEERQDKLSNEDAAIEAELLNDSDGDLPEASNDDIRTAAAGAESVHEAPKGGGGKAWMIVSAVLAILLIVVLIKPPFGSSNETVATVNGVNIGKDRLYDELLKAGGPATLENLITQELIMQEAKAASITVTDADVDSEIALIKKSFGTDEQFNSTLAQYNMTLDSLKKDTKINLTIRKILEPKTDVTEDEIKQYYDANKDQLGTPEQIQASHILVATKEEADAILAQLKQGGDFAAIAKEKSIDPGSKDNGGDLGFFGKGAMVPEFEEAAFALKVNEISGVVQSEHGFHIIKKTAEKAAVVPTFEEKKEEIKKQLVATEANELSEAWMNDIRAKAKITNSLTPAASADPAATEAPKAE
ncbi:peptidylprolyl isomerase [Bacillus sp. FJAT-26390]|uniref:peptidylprolyl isomerase n=1 Tax=Bacillus sp. FJAT-26390 TaxID=1743142 RepID=UPI0008080726|nr:peptidylprolyl isomerase [Bacillus sp. FJAT-26390]OBZ11186.1 peptidylprolyl isomerase [Bacillus sp. FJAT-26390]